MGLLSATRSVRLFAALLVVAICAAWSNSLRTPFVLDDLGNIADNATIRELGSLRSVLSPPADTGVGGRPFLNLTYALNYALSGLDVLSYHAVNLLIHTLAALTLFALLRHTLLRLPAFALPAQRATLSSAAAAALWALHPVQTQSVTYLSQRAESLMGLLYLLTLYCSARHFAASSAHSVTPSLRRPALWPVVAVLTCALGMATKEVMVTAPLLVLLYDRTFVSGTFGSALRTRRRFYLALAVTWLLLALLLADVTARGIGTAHGVSSFTYALTSCQTLLHYVRLSLWPSPLIFDYGPDFVAHVTAVLPSALAVVPLLAATLYAVAHYPRVGFVAASFFLLLAPTTSIIPIAFSPIAESRLYLPLAAVVTLIVLGLPALLGRRALFIFIPLSLALATATFLRNRTYATDLALWTDTVAKRPANASAHYNLGLMHSRAGQTDAAITAWRTTLLLEPAHPAAHNNLANALASVGRLNDSVPHYEAALRLNPAASVVRANFGVILLHLGRARDAAAQLRLAIRQNPANASAHHNLGLVLEHPSPAHPPDLPAALACYETALRLDPAFADAHHNAALLLARTDRLPAALVHLATVIRLRPGRPEPRLTLSRVLLNAGRHPAALAEAARAVRDFPSSPDAHLVLGNCHAYLGDFPSAIAAYESALRLRPDYPDAQTNLTRLRARLSR